MDERELEQQNPDIRWSFPLRVGLLSQPTQVRYACRYCIVMDEIKAGELFDRSFPTSERARQHIGRFHGKKAA